VRTFLAFDVEEHVRRRILEVTDRFRKIDPGIRWVKPDNMHVTLYFFGEVDESRQSELEEVCRNSTRNIGPFSIRVQGVSGFPSVERARVLWYGIQNEGAELNRMYESVRRKLRESDIVDRIENRPYAPHLTVGRVKRGMNRALIEEISRSAQTGFGDSRVSELVLYKSTLGSRGPIYDALSEFSL
jgi:2'-5' RNA ligase